MQLYDYQQKVIDDIEAKITAGTKRILTAAPTGSGKNATQRWVKSRFIAWARAGAAA
jgi:hypothetical protein